MASNKTVRVKVARGFYGPGFKLHHPGAVVELPELVAGEMIAANKATLTEEPIAQGKPKPSHGSQAAAQAVKAAAKE